MLELERVREALKRVRLDVVSEETGLSYTTIINIKNNPKANPTVNTIKALSRYLGVEA